MKSSKWIGCVVVIFLVGTIWPVAGWAYAPEAKIAHLVIKNSKDSLLVDLKIDSEFSPEMTAAALKGVPIRFTITISLYEVNDFWFDKKMADITAVQELRYDALKEVYKVIRLRPTSPPADSKDLDTARLLISEINDLAVISLADLKKGVHYQLMVDTVLSLKKSPFFNFFRHFKTDRYTVNFIY